MYSEKSKKQNSLVSIVVPSYNHEKFIEKCIDSIYSQSYKNFELIVIDDGSEDNSISLLNNLQKKYSFTFIAQENQGIARTLNRGFRDLSTGKYLTFCASDDYWLPDKLKMQVDFMENNLECPMCYGKAYVVDHNNKVDHESTLIANKGLRGGAIFDDLLKINFHLPVNYLFRRSIFTEVGFYREDIYTEDFYMNLKISNKYKVGFIDEFLFCYRINVGKDKKIANLKTSNSHLLCINNYSSSISYNEAIIKWNYRNFIWYAGSKQHKLVAVKGMLRSYKYCLAPQYISALFRLLFKWF
jgi:alpha-1,3-rhamnosyltransferase